jgi:thioredoxin reductase
VPREEERSKHMTTEPRANYDVVVVGGGAAGLSAALTLSRALRSVLVVDAGEPRNAPADHMHGYLGREGVAPGDFLNIGRHEVSGYGGHVLTDRVTSIQRFGPGSGTGFSVELAASGSTEARRLLLATGVIDELPLVPGIAQRWGRDVVHCPYCHGWEVRDRRIGVLATGRMGIHQALLFRQWSDHTVLLQHALEELTDEDRDRLTARGVTVIEGEVAALEIEGDELRGVRLDTGDVVSLDAVAVSPFLRARGDLLNDLGLTAVPFEVGETVVGTHVPTDAFGATLIQGVWAAGNITDPRAQVLTAAAAGQVAGAALNADLVLADTELELGGRRDGRSGQI